MKNIDVLRENNNSIGINLPLNEPLKAFRVFSVTKSIMTITDEKEFPNTNDDEINHELRELIVDAFNNDLICSVTLFNNYNILELDITAFTINIDRDSKSFILSEKIGNDDNDQTNKRIDYSEGLEMINSCDLCNFEGIELFYYDNIELLEKISELFTRFVYRVS